MKIVFNYQIFFQQQYGGISNYFYHLYKELNKNKDNQVKISLLKRPFLFLTKIWIQLRDIIKNMRATKA